jgi:hypothetical protein
MSETTHVLTPPNPDWKPWYQRPVPLAAAVLAVFLLAASVFIVSGGPDSSSPSTLPTGDTSATPEPGSDDWPRLNDPAPTSAPSGVVWKPAEGPAAYSATWTMLAPESPVFGPFRIDPATGAASGFDRSATGALIAAAQISIRATSPAQVDSGARGLASDGLKAAAAKDPEQVRGTPAIVGFRFIDYTPGEKAVVELIANEPALSQPAAITYVVEWLDGDWRITGPDMSNGNAQLTPWGSFTPWGEGA